MEAISGVELKRAKVDRHSGALRGRVGGCVQEIAGTRIRAGTRTGKSDT